MEPSPFGPGNPEHPSLAYVLLRFLRYGMLAWGGPVAQIALMHKELVERDRWIDEQRFRKTQALYQALPGPEATELAVYFGYGKRGRLGGLLAGLGFILPGLVLVFLAGFLYTTLLTNRAQWEPFLYGARPAVLALIFGGIVRLTRVNVKTPALAIIAIAVGGLDVLAPRLSFVPLLVGAGLLALLFGEESPLRGGRDAGAGWLGALPVALLVALPLFAAPAFLWVFAKGGLLTFGGAYTIVPVLHEGAVRANGWITNQEFLDALAITGVLPTPFVSVGSFVGYQAAGVFGFLVATVLVFAPAFAFTLAGHHFFERLVNEPRLHEFLLGVTAGVIGLLIASTVPLGRGALLDWWTVGILVGAFVLMKVVKLPTPVVMVLAAGTGWGLRAYS